MKKVVLLGDSSRVIGYGKQGAEKLASGTAKTRCDYK